MDATFCSWCAECCSFIHTAQNRPVENQVAFMACGPEDHDFQSLLCFPNSGWQVRFVDTSDLDAVWPSSLRGLISSACALVSRVALHMSCAPAPAQLTQQVAKAILPNTRIIHTAMRLVFVLAIEHASLC